MLYLIKPHSVYKLLSGIEPEFLDHESNVLPLYHRSIYMDAIGFEPILYYIHSFTENSLTFQAYILYILIVVKITTLIKGILYNGIPPVGRIIYSTSLWSGTLYLPSVGSFISILFNIPLVIYKISYTSRILYV